MNRLAGIQHLVQCNANPRISYRRRGRIPHHVLNDQSNVWWTTADVSYWWRNYIKYVNYQKKLSLTASVTHGAIFDGPPMKKALHDNAFSSHFLSLLAPATHDSSWAVKTGVIFDMSWWIDLTAYEHRSTRWVVCLKAKMLKTWQQSHVIWDRSGSLVCCI